MRRAAGKQRLASKGPRLARRPGRALPGCRRRNQPRLGVNGRSYRVPARPFDPARPAACFPRSSRADDVELKEKPSNVRPPRIVAVSPPARHRRGARSVPFYAEATDMRLPVEFACCLALEQLFEPHRGLRLVSFPSGQHAYVTSAARAFISAAVFFHDVALSCAASGGRLRLRGFSIPAGFPTRRQ